MGVAEKHQIKVAIKTLKMSDMGAFVMGGPTKEEAREILKKYGYTDKRIKEIEK